MVHVKGKWIEVKMTGKFEKKIEDAGGGDKLTRRNIRSESKNFEKVRELKYRNLSRESKYD